LFKISKHNRFELSPFLENRSNKKRYRKRMLQHEKIIMDAKIFEIDEKEIKKDGKS
jgi:hypothetical protein